MKTIFEQVKEQSLPLIKEFKNDLLIHDKKNLECFPHTPFIHFTGDSGTNMEMLHLPSTFPKKGEKTPYLFNTADREQLLQNKITTVINMPYTNRQLLILYYDGIKILNKISQKQAETIINNYADNIRFAWAA